MKREIQLTYLKSAKKFLDKNKSILTESEVDELVIKFIKSKFYGIDININYKQLQGEWDNFYRIRKGNIRVILSIKDDEIVIEAIIEDIGSRGDIYK